MKTVIWYFLSFFTFFTFKVFGSDLQSDLAKINETNEYAIYLHESSIVNLPPDWKKVWLLKNYKINSIAPSPKVKSSRINLVFDCVGMTYYTLAVINYSELDAQSKPILQLSSGFNPKEIAIENNRDYSLVFNRVCNKSK